MKKLLILLFSILISFNSYGLFGLFEDTVCVDTDVQKRGGIYYLPNETEPFTGNNLCKYENGQNKSEGKVEDGEVDGKWTLWYEISQKRSERNYKDGKLNGKYQMWHENGQKMFESNYKDGWGHGKWTYFHGNSQKSSELNYKDGMQDGNWTWWDENGQKKQERNYKGNICISGDCPDD